MRVSVLGAGYVGIVSAVCLAEKKHNVVCVDVAEKKVDKINRGISPIYEGGLEELLQKNIPANLQATTDVHKAIVETDLSLIAVETPFDGENIDLRSIEEVSRQVGEVLRDKDTYHVVVVKSTVVPGTTDEVIRPILEKTSGKKAGIDFGVGMNPEFLREGAAIQDFLFPDRIVIGAMDKRSHEFLDELYRPFENVDKIKTNNKTAEMIKYTSNSLLATFISFSNEIANLCAAIGDIDIVDVMEAVHLDKRLCPIMPDGERIIPAFTTYIEAGCGFGGSCFPKDLRALIAHGKKVGRPLPLLESVMQINEQQPQQVLLLLKKHFPSLKGIRIAILGLAFKPGTDDMRESPAIPIIADLLLHEAKIKAYDPVANLEAKKIFANRNIDFCNDLNETINDAQAILLVTRWEEFTCIPELINQLDQPPLVIDGRRMLQKNQIKRYEGIGL
jgi:UDPglucose 6-dehydrogenase/GDP-mannose 6-dehydrogenase